ncbi:kinesin-like protein KIF20B isoform X2 [Leguminivora glycinivorella]|uniref:kinesin-like protein KIF20B isoform X2 n=1 Tax=Leguminivora glycinivorella TaxID=1035111 RepID=UPI00200C43B7|nr:kinesin-like protein KIF20B isoform X2 [Leguminivora glycinivorella]
MDNRNTIDQRYSSDKGTNLLELFEEDDSIEEEGPELVQVYLRLKPSNVPSSLYEVRSDQCLITSVDTATAGHGRRTQHNVCKMYSFSHIFGPDANQKEIFEHVVKDNLRRLPDGHSFTLLTYGASGSGKTYTLMGTVKAPGLVPRSLEYVFKVVEAAQMPLYRPGEIRANKLTVAEQEYELQWVRNLKHLSAPLREKYRRMSTRLVSDMSRSTVDLSKRTKHYVWVSFVEIYNEAIYDLLVTTDRTASSKLRIREDPSGNVYVKGATQAFVRTGEEAYDVMAAGKHNLQVHATGVHAQSSRSHCIFTITMLTETETGVRASHVRLCDLAGSERARRTRNTGARMQESRAINSSLHVLERCLHTLRRKQTSKQDLVPYRESKLTRLLGTGLSGTRGEAVSMVVTLNPAPEYAHETRHVLQLAAVARDIQVNNTIAESISTLESTTCSTIQDTTIASSTEVTRLRAENERLHYELVQAESLNRKLMADMEEQQQENAVTVKELVEEAKDITEQYYKSQLRSLEERHNAEIAELREEHEARLAKHVVAEEGTPSRALQNKVMQLMKQIALLEEELNAERLAQARMKEEMLHLRACIEERDEKSSDDQDDAIQLTDSEDDSEDEEADDPCNESLEPTFKKEEINRSRLVRQSTLNNTRNTTFDNLDRTHDTVRDESMADATYDVSKKDATITEADETYDASNDTYNQSMDCPATVKKANSDVDKHSARETYFVSSSSVSLNEKQDSVQDSGHIADISVSLRDDDDLKDFSIIGDVVKPSKTIETQIDKIKKFAIGTVLTDSSLTQFEMLEKEMNENSAFKYFGDGTAKNSMSMSLRKKDKKPYFDDEQPTPNQISKVKDLIKKQDVLRSPSIVQDEIPENYKPSTINKIMRESITVTTELPPLYKNKILKKMHDSIDPFEGADSPCAITETLLKRVEETRKSIEKVSLDNQEKDSKAEAVKNATEMIIKSEIIEDVPMDKISVEEMRKSVEKVCMDSKEKNSDVEKHSLSGKVVMDSVEMEIKSEVEDVQIAIESETIKESVEKDLSNERNHAPANNEDTKTNENVLGVQSTGDEIISTKNIPDKDVKHDILTEIKQEEIIVEKIESVNKDTTKETKPEELTHEISSLNDITSSNQTIAGENTIDAFENIYKDITVPRATEFDLLISDKSLDSTNIKQTDKIERTSERSNLNKEVTFEDNVKNVNIKETVKDDITDNNNSEINQETVKNVNDNNNQEPETKVKYNLRHKAQDTSKTDKDESIEHTEKCAPRTAKKSLRLRRKNKLDEVEDEVKLKDIVNLQQEFSDVTLGLPAPVKVVNDIPSPEKSESENQPPLMGVQSCPSKSVTRSRRKLFTPRAEPLDESPPAGDSADDADADALRVRVPRPSYHRATRTRRRLN